MANEAGDIWLIYNGEIYNVEKLRRELGTEHHFQTHSDTELIVHLYEELGPEALARLNGIFSLALLDMGRESVFLARDPMGVKPLYYAETQGRFLFASEVKALLASGLLRAELDEEALELYLAFRYVPSPRTLFRNIRKLAPGRMLQVRLLPDGRGARPQGDRPFRTLLPALPEPRPEAEVVEELRGLLAAAVERQLVADVPVGLFLSGGLDSASLCALSSRCSPTGRRSFTVGFEQDDGLSEIGRAGRVAEHFATDHHTIRVGPDYFLTHWPKVVRHLDEPLGTSSALAMYAVSSLASQHLHVVLSGQGADELWGGYWRYFGEQFSRWYRVLPAWVGERLLPGAAGACPPLARFRRNLPALAIDDELTRFTELLAVFTADERRTLLGREAGDGPARVLAGYRDEYRPLSAGAKLCYLDTKLWMPDDLLMVCDKMAMAWSVELRVPFLDLCLVEAAERAPAHLRLKGMTRKYLLRRAMEPLLPSAFRRRPKQDFQLPLESWFRGPLWGFLREMLLGRESFCRGALDAPFIARMLEEHRRGVSSWTLQLYSLLSLESWWREFLGPQAAVGAFNR